MHLSVFHLNYERFPLKYAVSAGGGDGGISILYTTLKRGIFLHQFCCHLLCLWDMEDCLCEEITYCLHLVKIKTNATNSALFYQEIKIFVYTLVSII